MRDHTHHRPRPALDEEGLERLGLFYAGRYATTRAKLGAYLSRKVRERGWAGTGPPPVDHLVERFTALGYVDDSAFASARASSLLRRGYGRRRIDQALHAAGIKADDAGTARQQVEEGAFAAALRYAERKRIGPYARNEPDREARQKAIAAMLRAGHPMETVRKLVDARPGDIPESDF